MNQDRNYCHWIFYNLICWLEKYIEKAAYYSDWEDRKQVQKNPVIREDMNGPEKEDKLSLLASICFGATVHFEIAESSLKLYKEQFYKWIEATGIKVDNCPDRLKLILYALNEVLEGRTKKLEHNIENKKLDLDPDSPEFQEWEEKAFSLAIKNLGFKPKAEEFKGETEKGEKNFSEILTAVSPTDYANFYWAPQREEIPTDDSPAAQAAVKQLRELLVKAEKEDKKDNNQEKITKIIGQLEEFRDNPAAHEGKNNYAWRKLNGGSKLSSLRISLKMRDFRAPRTGKGNESSKETNNDTTKYWIIGISAVILFLLGLAILIKAKKKKKETKENYIIN